LRIARCPLDRFPCAPLPALPACCRPCRLVLHEISFLVLVVTRIFPGWTQKSRDLYID
jgi:hypothetical protein